MAEPRRRRLDQAASDKIDVCHFEAAASGAVGIPQADQVAIRDQDRPAAGEDRWLAARRRGLATCLPRELPEGELRVVAESGRLPKRAQIQ